MNNIAIGVIGAGLIGRKHLRKLAEHRDYDLVGIADVNVDAVSAEHPKTRVFADYRHLLDEARPEAVIIASPNQMHAETGIECARRGIHILIEKPVTDTVETAAALIAEVRKGGIRSLVGHHRRHHLQVKTLKALLGEGRIGDVVGVSAIWATHKPTDYFKACSVANAARWRPDPDQSDPRDRFSAFHGRRNHSRGGDRLEPPARLCGRGYCRRADRIRQWRARQFLRQRQRRLAMDDGAGRRRVAGISVQRRKQLPVHGPSRRAGIPGPGSMGRRQAARRTGTSRSSPSASTPPRSILMSPSSIISATSSGALHLVATGRGWRTKLDRDVGHRRSRHIRAARRRA